ncbi:molybdopterin-guanine dinucleotide biosynthesis protein B [Clostridium sp.]|uniref:molybdopterin-guanine dinucleotide biosynthesis protein B n=1 Tax=Clostridium sp. TaxID=1506 RepID=UPI003F3A6665
MPKIVNIIGSGSNVGKTILIEGIIKELKNRNYSVGTIKHDVHGFDIDHKGKDTYKHREAGSETVIISSKNRFAMIKELEEEISLEDIIKMIDNKDFIIVEGYKKSNLRKIEVIRSDISNEIITPRDKLIAIASDVFIDIDGVPVIEKDNYKSLVDIIEMEKENNR